jgi:hypothetical protein
MRRFTTAALLALVMAPLAGCVVATPAAPPQQVVIQREPAATPAPGTTTYITPGQPSSTVVVEPARRY